MKTAVWTKSVFKKLLQLAQMVYYSREYEGGKQRQKRTNEKAQVLVTAVKTAMNQPEGKNAQRNPDEKGWACYHCGKEWHLKRSCPQASKPCPAPHQVCKGPHWRRHCPQRHRPQGQALRTIRTACV